MLLLLMFAKSVSGSTCEISRRHGGDGPDKVNVMGIEDFVNGGRCSVEVTDCSKYCKAPQKSRIAAAC